MAHQVGEFLFGSSSESNRRTQELIDQVLSYYDTLNLDAVTKRGLKQSKKGERKATRQIKEGYQQSQQALAGASLASRQAAYRSQSASLGQAKNFMANRGLSTSTAAPRQYAGIRDQTSNTIGQIESGLAGLRSSLSMAKGSALSGVSQRGAETRAGLLDSLARYRLAAAGGKAGFLSNVNFQPQPGAAGGIASLATAAAAFSDRRLKENVERIRALNGYTYNFKGSDQRTGGVMAQEVEKVVPEAVIVDPETGFKMVNYTMLVAVILEAVKELASEVDEMKGQRFDI